MTHANGSRRPRGSSPRGEFEHSKATALEEIAKEKADENAKTAKLKALRLARDAKYDTSRQ